MIHVDCTRLNEELNLAYLNEWYDRIAGDEGFLLGDLSVILGDDEWLLEFNRKFLNHNFYTDIITFDYVEGGVISGDLLISYERVAENSLGLNVSRETELNRVLIHGFLHLCGYNDKTCQEKEIMRKKEDFYLNLL